MTNLASNKPATGPIPVCGIQESVSPRLEMPIPLYWDHIDGINWSKGEPVSKAQLSDAIIRERGLRLPNDILPALDPGDVVILSDGTFWIDRDWMLQPVSQT